MKYETKEAYEIAFFKGAKVKEMFTDRDSGSHWTAVAAVSSLSKKKIEKKVSIEVGKWKSEKYSVF